MQYDEDPSTPTPEDLDAAIKGTLGQLKHLLEQRHGGEWKASVYQDAIEPDLPITGYYMTKEHAA